MSTQSKHEQEAEVFDGGLFMPVDESKVAELENK